MKTILVSAYAVNPYKGSEDGMGWNMILQIARFHRVIAITRKNNKPKIVQYIKENYVQEAENICFKYYDLPYYLRFWKKGSKGALLYFYLWQLGLAFWVKRRSWAYDIVHNLNFHNDWTPSFLWILKKPFVWGPIGHHPEIPSTFLKKYGWSMQFKDKLTWWVKQFFWKVEPFLNITARKADIVFVMNDSVQKQLKIKTEKIQKLPSVGSESIDFIPTRTDKSFTVISIGRFVPLKGFDITIRSFAAFYYKLSEEDQSYAQLILVGKGSFENQLKNLVKELGIEHAITFIDWIERDRLFKIYQKAKVFLFPSHEGAGMVVSEALSFGLPVLCFDNCGPGEFIDESCGFKIPYKSYEKAVDGFAEKLCHLFHDRLLLSALSANAVVRHRENFDWNLKGKRFKDVYEQILYSSEKEITTVHTEPY